MNASIGSGLKKSREKKANRKKEEEIASGMYRMKNSSSASSSASSSRRKKSVGTITPTTNRKDNPAAMRKFKGNQNRKRALNRKKM